MVDRLEEDATKIKYATDQAIVEQELEEGEDDPGPRWTPTRVARGRTPPPPPRTCIPPHSPPPNRSEEEEEKWAALLLRVEEEASRATSAETLHQAEGDNSRL